MASIADDLISAEKSDKALQDNILFIYRNGVFIAPGMICVQLTTISKME